MLLTPNSSSSSFLTRTGKLLGAGLAVVAMTLVAGHGASKDSSGVTGVDMGTSLVLDAAVFGSSAGQASIKSAPTTWSSRSNVRWNARWAADARYVV